LRLHTPAQLEALTGLTVGNQRASSWRTILEGRSQQSNGGHWRFRDADCLYVSAVKVVAGMGFELSVAAQIIEMCLGEVADAVRGRPLKGVENTHPYIFVWRIEDTANTILKETGGVSAIQGTSYCAYRLKDLSRIPDFSRSGGFVLIPSDIARKIPQAVADLFLVTP
jgi:hypothetical protein